MVYMQHVQGRNINAIIFRAAKKLFSSINHSRFISGYLPNLNYYYYFFFTLVGQAAYKMFT